MSIEKESSDKFYQNIYSLATRRKFPLKAMFELTHRCNFRCIHCYVVPDRSKKELTTKQVKEVLNQLRDAGCFHIGFTGGEPLIRKDIFEILNYAKRNGFRISVLTNGFSINKKIAREIASLGTSLNRVDISVLGATKDTFEKITGRNGSFTKVIQAIKLLKDEGVDVQIKSILMKPNQDEFLKIKKLADKFNTMFRYSSMINPKINADKNPLRYQVEPKEVYRINTRLSSSKSIINEQAKEGWNIKNIGRRNLFRCGAGQSEIVISPYGEMRLCLEIPYPQYNILRGSFAEGWKKIKEFVENFKVPADYLCKKCVIASFCQWCPARGWLVSDSLTKCSKEDREMALVEAMHSPVWDKIAPLWNKQERYAYKTRRI